MFEAKPRASRVVLGIASYFFTITAMAQAPSITVNNNSCPTATASITYGGSTGVSSIAIQTNGCGTTQTPIAPTITSGTPTLTASVGAQYSFTFTATGTTPISWALSPSSNLPPGLSLSTGGVLSGIPTAGGTPPFTFSVVASNSGTPNASAGPYALTVNNNPAITNPLPSPATVGLPYSHTFTASQSSPAITWSLASGSNALPAWVTLNPSTGILSGTPSLANVGTTMHVVQATNANGSGTQDISLTVNASVIAPTITTAAPPAGMVGTPYSYTFGASGSSPITWTNTGPLPAGLTLNASTGTLSGTPTAVGMSTFTVTASNAPSSSATSGNLTINIAAASGGASPFDTSVDDGVIPTPSKVPNVIPAFRNGRLNGAGSYINAYAAELTSCATGNAQLGANATIVRRWQHNINFVDYQFNQSLDFIAMAPRESLTYMFTTPAASSAQRIQFQRDTSATWAPVLMSISATPCDFDITKFTDSSTCHIPDNNIYLEIGNGPISTAVCTLRPNTKYYLNIRFLRRTDLNNDACSLTPTQRCGGILQIQ